MIETSEQNKKIPVTLIRDFLQCECLAKLKYDERVNESNSDSKSLGILLHEGFSLFHQSWTDELYNVDHDITTTKLKLILDQCYNYAISITENKPTYLRLKKEFNKKFERIFRGNNGIISKIVNSLKQKYKDRSFNPSEGVLAYFKGDPSFELSMENEFFTGRADVVVEVDETNEFYVWELKTGKMKSAPYEADIFQTISYVLMYEQLSGKSCLGIKLLYLGEKEFDIAISNELRNKTKEYQKNILKTVKNEVEPCVNSANCENCHWKSFCEYYSLNPSYSIKSLNSEEDYITVNSINEKDSNNKSNSNEESNLPQVHSQNQDGMLVCEDKVQISCKTSDNLSNASGLSKITQNAPQIKDDAQIENFGEYIYGTRLENAQKSSSISKTPNKVISTDHIGIIIQNEDRPLILSSEKDNKLNGAINRHYQRKIHPGQILIADNDIDIEKPSAIVEVREIKSYPKNVGSFFSKMSVFDIFLTLYPFMYFEKKKYSRVLFPEDFSSHKLRIPNEDELIKIMNLFSEGIPLGLVTYEPICDELPSTILPYYFPFNFKEAAYKGIFVVGSPGKGKTNILKIMLDGISNYVGTDTGKPPATIVLDITDQFGNLELQTKHSTVLDESIWKIINLKMVQNVKKFKISYEGGIGNYTLSLNAIDPELITLLFPEIPPTSAHTFQRFVRTIFKKYPSIDFPTFQKKIEELLDAEGDALNSSVKRAIISAVKNGPSEYFDQSGIPLIMDKLLVPGQVSVIQVAHIPNPLPVLLYILMLINKKKIFEGDQTPLILMMDEAHELFPKTGGDTQNYEYLKRITQNLIKIARRGRKKHLGLIFASQQPKDIIPEIIGVFQTKVILGLEASSSEWIKNTVGREYVNMILRLEQGQARVSSAELHKGTLVPLLIPKAPNQHEEE